MSTDCAPSPLTSSGQLDEMWRRQLVWWHTLFGALLVVTAGLVVASGSGRTGLQLGLLAALVLVYAVWGRRALGQGDPRAGTRYALLAWALFFGLLLLDTEGAPWLLTFALFPQTWAILERDRAIPVVVVVVAAFAGIRLWQAATTGETATGIVISSVTMLALSLVLGLFIDRVIREANSRARAIDELRRAQAELAAAERAQGVFAERERLSREIHDTLAQGFTSVVTLARAADAALDRGDLATVRERLALMESTAAENLAEARLIVAALTPGHLQNGTLAEALQRVVDTASAESGIDGTLTVVGSPGTAAANSEVVVLRTAQEAIANIRRHSGAATFSVRLDYVDPERVSLEVTDDGRGFDPSRATSGFGLVGAQSRAADLGTELLVDTAPGSGTTLRVSVPR